ncbi:uncharacterized protein LOC132392153 [Hypanus sabinus]|uniref:uncharacterized protein LOC132392153 n=1 Tax=Hypanus sabinus TaxID=79690 RepID=UPI0028C477A9|nr:uncharacterized protein LOC132392153 [Hypanus sabinus]
MSEGRSPSNDNGTSEDHVSTASDLKSGDNVLEVALENTDDLQGQSGVIEALSLENHNQGSMAEDFRSSGSRGLDGNVMTGSGVDEALSDVSKAQSSLEERVNRIDKVVDELSKVADSKPATEAESSSRDVFPPSSAQASETHWKDKLSDAKGFIGDNISPSTHPEGKKKDQSKMTTMDTQTVWVSLDTPGSSLTDLQMEVPEELKFRSLGLKPLSLDVTMDSERIYPGTNRLMQSRGRCDTGPNCKRLQRVVDSASSILGTALPTIEDTFKRKAAPIIKNLHRPRHAVGVTAIGKENEAFQKQFRSEESGIENTEARSEDSDFEVNPSESSEGTVSGDVSVGHLRDFQVAIVKSSSFATCEFCKQIRMSFPNPRQLEMSSPAKFFCCNMSWELYQEILNQKENLDYEESDSDQDGFYPTELEVEEAMMKLAARIKNPEVRMYMTPVIHRDKVIFTSIRTISFRLSSEHCMKQGWTLKPPQAETVTFEDLSQYVPSASSFKEAERPRGIMERYYPDGSKFVTMFPDGTGTVFYPSGNIAMVISALRYKQLVYAIFEDLEWNAKMLGVFWSTGYGTCYLPSGQIWISITPRCGFYFTEQGLLRKQWLWRDCHHHVHAPPYNSISLELNSNIGVQVVSRDKIYATFKMRKRSIRFNVGAKLVLRDLEQAGEAQSDGTEPESYVDEAKQKIHVLTDQMKRL